MKKFLIKNKDEHYKLDTEIQMLLAKYKDAGKDPNPIAKGMSWIKTNVKLAVDESDETIADLMTDGCNMGVKSLYKYLNQYPAADIKVKNLCQKLIDIEEELCRDLRVYL